MYLTSSLKIKRNNNLTISIYLIQIELSKMNFSREDVNNCLKALFNMAKTSGQKIYKSKYTKNFNTQRSLMNVLENLIERLKKLKKQVLFTRNHNNQKQALLTLSQNFQQLKLEIDLFQEMHFRVKRNYFQELQNFQEKLDVEIKNQKMAA